MNKYDIIFATFLLVVLFLFAILVLALVIDYNEYQNPEMNLDKTKVGDYLIVNGIIKSYLGETSVERLICSKGCFTTYRTKYAYVILIQNQEITVLFNDKQQIDNTVTVETKVKENYFEEV